MILSSKAQAEFQRTNSELSKTKIFLIFYTIMNFSSSLKVIFQLGNKKCGAGFIKPAPHFYVKTLIVYGK